MPESLGYMLQYVFLCIHTELCCKPVKSNVWPKTTSTVSWTFSGQILVWGDTSEKLCQEQRNPWLCPVGCSAVQHFHSENRSGTDPAVRGQQSILAQSTSLHHGRDALDQQWSHRKREKEPLPVPLHFLKVKAWSKHTLFKWWNADQGVLIYDVWFL